MNPIVIGAPRGYPAGIKEPPPRPPRRHALHPDGRERRGRRRAISDIGVLPGAVEVTLASLLFVAVKWPWCWALGPGHSRPMGTPSPPRQTVHLHLGLPRGPSALECGGTSALNRWGATGVMVGMFVGRSAAARAPRFPAKPACPRVSTSTKDLYMLLSSRGRRRGLSPFAPVFQSFGASIPRFPDPAPSRTTGTSNAARWRPCFRRVWVPRRCQVRPANRECPYPSRDTTAAAAAAYVKDPWRRWQPPAIPAPGRIQHPWMTA